MKNQPKSHKGIPEKTTVQQEIVEILEKFYDGGKDDDK